MRRYCTWKMMDRNIELRICLYLPTKEPKWQYVASACLIMPYIEGPQNINKRTQGEYKSVWVYIHVKEFQVVRSHEMRFPWGRFRKMFPTCALSHKGTHVNISLILSQTYLMNYPRWCVLYMMGITIMSLNKLKIAIHVNKTITAYIYISKCNKLTLWWSSYLKRRAC